MGVIGRAGRCGEVRCVERLPRLTFDCNCINSYQQMYFTITIKSRILKTSNASFPNGKIVGAIDRVN